MPDYLFSGPASASTTLLLAHGAGTPMDSDWMNAMAAAIGQALGRIGCFLVGDDYGRPTDGWFGIAFPEGAPPTLERVHPTQLYEAAWLFALTAFLWARRDRSPRLWAEYFMLAAVGRFAVEFLRVNPRVWLGHFELWEEGEIIFRHGMALMTGEQPSLAQAAAMIHTLAETRPSRTPISSAVW